MKPNRIEPGPGQESVWDYPRPPRLEATTRRVLVTLGGIILADTRRAFRVLETSHPPVYYIPEADIRMEFLSKNAKTSYCEWKGRSHYFDIAVDSAGGNKRLPNGAWGYAHPTPAFSKIDGHVAFYAAPMDSVTVDGEVVIPQPGGFYGGWITSDIVGPFKGEPGTFGW